MLSLGLTQILGKYIYMCMYMADVKAYNYSILNCRRMPTIFGSYIFYGFHVPVDLA